MLPIQTPSQPLSTSRHSASNTATPAAAAAGSSPFPMRQSASHPIPARELPIVFDSKVVAKKDDGWEDMLENVLFSWVDKVVEEKRVHH